MDEQYRTACGPIACFVTLRRFGEGVSLRSVVDECGWQPGTQTSFARLCEVFARHDSVDTRAVRLTPDELVEWLRGGDGDRAAVLAVRKSKDGADHAVSAVGVDGDRVITFDYPELYAVVSKNRLTEVWGGEAILVAPRPRPAWQSAAAFAPGAVLAVAVGFAVGRRRSGPLLPAGSQPPPPTQVPPP